MNFIWKLNIGAYQTGESLYLNRICLGGYYWNCLKASTDKDKSTDWVGQISLPSLKSNTVYGGTTEEVKTNMEKLFIQWFKEVNYENRSKE